MLTFNEPELRDDPEPFNRNRNAVRTHFYLQRVQVVGQWRLLISFVAWIIVIMLHIKLRDDTDCE